MRSDFPRWIPFWLLFSGLACSAAVLAEYEGQTFETQPIEIKVVEGPSSPAPETAQQPKLEGGTIL